MAQQGTPSRPFSTSTRSAQSSHHAASGVISYHWHLKYNLAFSTAMRLTPHQPKDNHAVAAIAFPSRFSLHHRSHRIARLARHMMQARNVDAAGKLRDRAIDASCARSSALITNSAFGRAVRIGHSPGDTR